MYQEQEDPFSFFSIFSAPSLAKIYGHPTPGSSRRERQSAFTRSVRNWETFAESNIFGFVWADSRTAPYLLYANWFTSLYSTDTAASSFGLKEITVDEISVVVVSYQRALLCFFLVTLFKSAFTKLPDASPMLLFHSFARFESVDVFSTLSNTCHYLPNNSRRRWSPGPSWTSVPKSHDTTGRDSDRRGPDQEDREEALLILGRNFQQLNQKKP